MLFLFLLAAARALQFDEAGGLQCVVNVLIGETGEVLALGREVSEQIVQNGVYVFGNGGISSAAIIRLCS
ncbi:hypothetical protein CVO74_22420 [Xanthomonas prunicola]|uniref:Uncharacterized protein n=1 Tax=Xanthomonas prunicola TaxID=2053930 RepID=A0A2N3RET9_9XANT|nr:hypothetical protein XpruCFBP8353_20245 [Xanthomonas prunicola]PKV15169.1 hypothetical protein XpruCFBP8354_21030 [Xanthomonas prunicola]PKV19158.1 hypothetical protein CVO74_22420 [Xanthomonas prunicola]